MMTLTTRVLLLVILLSALAFTAPITVVSVVQKTEGTAADVDEKVDVIGPTLPALVTSFGDAPPGPYGSRYVVAGQEHSWFAFTDEFMVLDLDSTDVWALSAIVRGTGIFSINGREIGRSHGNDVAGHPGYTGFSEYFSGTVLVPGKNTLTGFIDYPGGGGIASFAEALVRTRMSDNNPPPGGVPEADTLLLITSGAAGLLALKRKYRL